jgi:hypothetical protein
LPIGTACERQAGRGSVAIGKVYVKVDPSPGVVSRCAPRRKRRREAGRALTAPTLDQALVVR